MCTLKQCTHMTNRFFQEVICTDIYLVYYIVYSLFKSSQPFYIISCNFLLNFKYIIYQIVLLRIYLSLPHSLFTQIVAFPSRYIRIYVNTKQNMTMRISLVKFLYLASRVKDLRYYRTFTTNSAMV